MTWTPRILAVDDEETLLNDTSPKNARVGVDFADTNTKKKISQTRRKSRLRGRPTKRGLKPKGRQHVTIWLDEEKQ